MLGVPFSTTVTLPPDMAYAATSSVTAIAPSRTRSLYVVAPSAVWSSASFEAPVAAKSDGVTHGSGMNQPERLTPRIRSATCTSFVVCAGDAWSSLPIMAVVTVVGSLAVMILSSKLNIMSLGDNSAISLGVDIQKFRLVCLILMAVMTAAIVSFTGILGFIGLVAPHLVRLVIGSDNRFVVPLSMSVGALLMLVSDYLAFQFASIPVGVVLSVIGSPVFFALIVWQNKRTGAIY